MTHQQRYRDAWEKYRDPTLTDAERQVLEQEMDSAQNDFTWDEFQDFKKTLPGYLEHWKTPVPRLLVAGHAVVAGK